MNKIKLNHQVSLFGDFSSISTDAPTVKILLDELSSYSMMPTTFNELKMFPDGRQVQSQRVSFLNNETGLSIFFGLDKLDISHQMTREDGSNVDNIEDFIKKVETILMNILDKFSGIKYFSRMSLVSSYFIDIDDKDKFYNSLVVDPFKKNSNEWSLRIAQHPDLLGDTGNNVTIIERIQGQIINQSKIKEFDNIKVTIDINTKEKVSALIDKKNLKTFLEESLIIQNETLLKIIN